MTDPRQWPPGKMLLALLGLLVLAAVGLQGLERLAPREAGSVKKKGAGSSEPQAIRPTLERVDDWTILVTAGIMHQSRFRFGEDDGIERVDALYTCLEERIAQEFDDNPTTKRSEMRSRMKEIQDHCLQIELRVPSLPALPALPALPG